MIEIQAKRKPKAKVSAMEKIVLMVFTGCVLRFLWFIVILPGRHGSVVWGGAVLEGILLKVPQVSKHASRATYARRAFSAFAQNAQLRRRESRGWSF